MKSEKITQKSLFSSILLLIMGVLLLTNSDEIISVLSIVIGSMLVLIGLIKFINFIKIKKEYPNHDVFDLTISLLLIILGLVLAFVPSIINISIRLIFGGWILIMGINRLVLGLTIKVTDTKGYKIYLISSMIMILVGIFILFNLFGIIGIYLIIYSISDIIGYVYSNMTNKTKPKTNKKRKPKKIKKAIKEKKAIDAEIIK